MPMIFISHRHRDREIAAEISSFIQRSTGGRVNVFCSSDGKSCGLSVGRIINQEIAKKLHECSVLILIHTRSDDDWTYCMWECGVAFDINRVLDGDQSGALKIVVFQFTSSAPRPLQELVNVDVRSVDSVAQFVRQLLTDTKFFNESENRITDFSPNDPNIQQLGRELYEKLQRFNLFWEQPQRRNLWPRMTFSLPLKFEEELRQKKYTDSIYDLVLENLIVQDNQDAARAVFDVSSSEGLSLSQLSEHKINVRSNFRKWIESLVKQVQMAIKGRCINPNWEDLTTEGNGYVPMVLACSRLPSESLLSLEIIFPQFTDQSENSGNLSRSSDIAPQNLRPVSGQPFMDPTTTIRFLWVDGDSVLIGSNEIEEEAHAKPEHRIQLSSFWISETPITRSQFQLFLDNTGAREPNYWVEDRFSHPTQPVVGVSWEMAKRYCEWLGHLNGLNVNLPTEAQWEFAARGPEKRKYPWGEDSPDEKTHACFGKDEQSGYPCIVGSYLIGEGPYGTLDQSGNVWEWCLDSWDEQAYQRCEENCLNPVVNKETPWRALRGGAWDISIRDIKYLQSAYRMGNLKNIEHWAHGFRVVVNIV